MTRRRPLTLAGGDVALRARSADGRAIVEYIDLAGRPLGHWARCHAFQLRGVGWHIAAIKQAIANLPLEGTTASPDMRPAPRALLFAHHVAARTED